MNRFCLPYIFLFFAACDANHSRDHTEKNKLEVEAFRLSSLLGYSRIQAALEVERLDKFRMIEAEINIIPIHNTVDFRRAKLESCTQHKNVKLTDEEWEGMSPSTRHSWSQNAIEKGYFGYQIEAILSSDIKVNQLIDPVTSRVNFEIQDSLNNLVISSGDCAIFAFTEFSPEHDVEFSQNVLGRVKIDYIARISHK